VSPSHTFFWHDYETFGRNPRRDRPVQFAGQRTDAELNPIGQPVMWMCQPPLDSLPEPEACLLTGIVPQQAQREGIAEHRFAAHIHSVLSQDGTIGVGYNSIRFDDEVSRFLFWRNLIDPYGREWRNQCSRWDLLDVVRCAWSLRPEGIQWPRHADGRPSFKLEDLTRANGLQHEAAHDAQSDVLATIAVARLIKTQRAQLWAHALRLRDKRVVADEIGQGRPFLHISGMYPVERGCMAMVWPLGRHPTNANELIVWDLSADPAQLEGMDAASARLRMFTRQDQLPEGVTRLPIKTVHLNKSPMVIGNVSKLGGVAARWGLDMAAIERHARVAQQLTPLLSGLWQQVFVREDDGADKLPRDVDEDLYGGFIGDGDRRTLDGLRAMTPQALATRQPSFDDPRLSELLFRYRARNFPQTLTDDEAARWQEHRVARLHEGAHGALTLAQFQEQIDTLAHPADDSGEQAEPDERAQDILAALYDWGETIAP
jgi:exodeoxyribonuclease I